MPPSRPIRATSPSAVPTTIYCKATSPNTDEGVVVVAGVVRTAITTDDDTLLVTVLIGQFISDIPFLIGNRSATRRSRWQLHRMVVKWVASPGSGSYGIRKISTIYKCQTITNVPIDRSHLRADRESGPIINRSLSPGWKQGQRAGRFRYWLSLNYNYHQFSVSRYPGSGVVFTGKLQAIRRPSHQVVNYPSRPQAQL